MRRRQILIAIGGAGLVVAATLAYGLNSRVGGEFLRRDVEARLSKLLRGEVHVNEVKITFDGGLGLRGEGVTVYPSPAGSGLYAETVVAELNEAALLIGELRLAELAFEGLQVRLALDPDGVWSFPPLRALQHGTRPAAPPEAATAPDEPALRLLASLERISRNLLTQWRIADRISIRNGELRFDDLRSPTDAADTGATRPRRLHLKDVRGELTRSWLGGEGEIELSGSLAVNAGGDHRIEIRGDATSGAGVRVSLNVEEVDLDSLDTSLDRLSPGADVDGRIAGSFHFETREAGTQTFEIDLNTRDLVAALAARGESVRVALPFSRVRARLEVEPRSVRLVGGRATGQDVAFGLTGLVERPIRPSSLARIDAELRGFGLEQIRVILAQLPERDRQALELWFEPLEAGLVEEVGIKGSVPLSRWGELIAGELDVLPQSLILRLTASNLTLRVNERNTLEAMHFQAEWARDRLRILDAGIPWRGAKVASLRATIDGVSRFLDVRDQPGAATGPILPGVPYLWDLLAGDDGDEDEPSQSNIRQQIEIEIEIESLRHPLLRWPIEDALLVIQPIAGGSQAILTRASWGGVPIAGEAVYLKGPHTQIELSLEALESPDTRTTTALTPTEAATPKTGDGVWGTGRFTLDAIGEPVELPADGGAETGLLLRHLSADFALTGSELTLEGLLLTSFSGASAEADVRLDLRTRDQLALEMQLRIDDGSVEHLGDAVGFRDAFSGGQIDASADLKGTLHRGRNPFKELSGSIDFTATDGDLRLRIPLVVTIATMTDGFNPFASRDSLHYESVLAELELAEGRLLVDRFELEGAVRAYGEGSLDFGESPYRFDGVVGVFLLQRAGELLGMVPLVNLVVPGSDKGMVGAYFRLHGTWEKPKITSLAGKSLYRQLPGLITKPVDLLHSLFTSKEDSPAGRKRDKRQPDEAPTAKSEKRSTSSEDVK